jgi:CBS domain-containing protein
MRVRDLMQIQPITIDPEATLHRAAGRLLGYGVNGLPVVDQNDQVVGMIGLMDVLRAPFPDFARVRVSGIESEPSMGRRLDLMRVAQVMATDVISVEDDDPMGEAVTLMVKSGVHPLPVLRHGRLVGIISRANALNAMLYFHVEPKLP